MSDPFHKGQRVQVTAYAHESGVCKTGPQIGTVTGVGEYVYVVKDGQRGSSKYSLKFWEPVMSDETVYPGCVTITCKACGTVEPIVRSDGTPETDLELAAVAYVLNKPDSRMQFKLAAELVGIRLSAPALELARAERDRAVEDLRMHDEGHCGQSFTEQIKLREAADARADGMKDRVRALEEGLREACRQITAFARATDYDEASEVADKLVELADE